MADPMEPEFTAQNPIVAAAQRIRARRDLGAAIDAATGQPIGRPPEDAEESLRLFCSQLVAGADRFNAIVGRSNGIRVVRLEKPLRVKLRFREHHLALELDDIQQLVRVRGLDLDGAHQFVPNAASPALINISRVSTESGYGDELTASSLLKLIAQDAELPRPPHLDSSGPLSF